MILDAFAIIIVIGKLVWVYLSHQLAPERSNAFAVGLNP